MQEKLTGAVSTPRRWRRRLLQWGGQLLLALLLLWGVEAFLSRDALGVSAPAIEATTLSGEGFSLQQLRGTPAVIHFWATWCPVCELEQGTVDALAAEQPLITIAMQSGSGDEVRDYLQQQGVDYPVINDEHGLLSQSYGVKAVPASFVLDRDGKVRFVTRGYTSGWGLRLRLWLAAMM